MPTHLSARQAVAHGHFLVNGKKSYTPSLNLKKGDKITVREGSKNSKLFNNLEEQTKNMQVPAWISADYGSKEITIEKIPTKSGIETFFDLGQVIEFYQR